MHRTIANTLSELRTEWASSNSLWSFLAHLNDLDFYKGLDEQCEVCIAPRASCREGVHGKRSAPIECVGVTYEMKATELIAGGRQGNHLRRAARSCLNFYSQTALARPQHPVRFCDALASGAEGRVLRSEGARVADAMIKAGNNKIRGAACDHID
jgi:hypothetical protein